MIPTSSKKDLRAIGLDFLERAGWSAAQAFLAVLLLEPVAVAAVGRPYQLALSMALGAALVSVVATALQYLAGMTDLGFWEDTAVRVVKTFLASLGASFGADRFDVLSFAWGTAVDVAVLAALTALAKAILARNPSPFPPPGDHPEGTTARLVQEGTPSTLPTSTYGAAIRRSAPTADDRLAHG